MALIQKEREKQDVVINIEIHYPADTACLNDEVEQALNYKDITKAVIKLVEEGHFLLLEKLVADVLEQCHAHPKCNLCQSID